MVMAQCTGVGNLYNYIGTEDVGILVGVEYCVSCKLELVYWLV